MPRESCPGLLLTLVSVFVGLCESSAAGRTATSDAQQPQPQPPQQQPQPRSQQQYPVCESGLEFWSAERASCWPCTRCAPEFTLSPCVIHKDAICGPLSALELDWSFLSSTARKRSSRAGDDDGTVTPNVIPRFPEEKTKEGSFTQADNLVNLDCEDNGSGKESVLTAQESKTAHDPRDRRKSVAEDNLPWDWQTGALVLAVCACILFFMVAGCSALVYARQWRRMKRNFEPAGLEEISARLNLMVKAELAELVAGAPMNPGDPETRCQYLEKLLDRKRETPVVTAAAATATTTITTTTTTTTTTMTTTTTAATAATAAAAGNLYIEEGGTMTPRSKRSQIARIQRNIETILSHKTSEVDRD